MLRIPLTQIVRVKNKAHPSPLIVLVSLGQPSCDPCLFTACASGTTWSRPQRMNGIHYRLSILERRASKCPFPAPYPSFRIPFNTVPFRPPIVTAATHPLARLPIAQYCSISC